MKLNDKTHNHMNIFMELENKSYHKINNNLKRMVFHHFQFKNWHINRTILTNSDTHNSASPLLAFQ